MKDAYSVRVFVGLSVLPATISGKTGMNDPVLLFIVNYIFLNRICLNCFIAQG